MEIQAFLYLLASISHIHCQNAIVNMQDIQTDLVNEDTNPLSEFNDILDEPIQITFPWCHYNQITKSCKGLCFTAGNPFLLSKCQQMTLYPPFSNRHCGCPTCKWNAAKNSCTGKCPGVQTCAAGVNSRCECFDCGKPFVLNKRWTCEGKKCPGTNMSCQLDIDSFETSVGLSYGVFVCRCKAPVIVTTTTTTISTTTKPATKTTIVTTSSTTTTRLNSTTTTTTTIYNSTKSEGNQVCRLIKQETVTYGSVNTCGGLCPQSAGFKTDCVQFSLYPPQTDADCGCQLCEYNQSKKRCSGRCGRQHTCIPLAKVTYTNADSLLCGCDDCGDPFMIDGAWKCEQKPCGITGLNCTLSRQETAYGVIPFCTCKY